MKGQGKKRDVSLSEAENMLRGLETKEYVMSGVKRVDLFKGADALVYLMDTKKKKADEARKMLQALLENHYIVKVRSDREEMTCTMEVEYLFNINNDYVWIKEGSQTKNILLGTGIIFLALSIVMFQVWPRRLKYYTTYLFHFIFILVGLLLATSIVRLIVYGATVLTLPKGLWIFPNLFEDCGILESFFPLYAFEGPAQEEEKGTR
jgi:translocation protein SEC62